MSRLPVLALILIVLGAPGCLTRTVVVRSRDAGCSGPVQATLEPQEVLAAVAAPDGSIYLDVQYDHERVERVVLRPFGPSLEPLDLAVGRLAEEVAARLASLRAKPAAEPAATHWAELAPPEPLPPDES